MDLEEFNKEELSKERLELSEPRWSRIMSMLVQEGYVTGIDTWKTFDSSYPRVLIIRPEITIKGLEYLENNSLMKKASDLAKGIKDIVTGL